MLKRNIYLLALLFALCLWLPDTAFAAETQYRITASELNQLESSLNQLKIISENSQTELQKLKTELSISKNELMQARNESKLLKIELATLKQTSQKQTELLQSANKSLAAYAAEEKKRQRVIKAQRNIAYGVSAVLLYALVRK